jgi:cyclin C
MSSNFYASSHNLYHIYPRPTLYKARAIDRLYASPRQLLCLSIWFANLIQKVGKKLMLRQVPIATATIYFKRFYLKNSYCETNPYLVLAACLLVAAKVEETPVHIKSVVSEAKTVFTGMSALHHSKGSADRQNLGSRHSRLKRTNWVKWNSTS